MFNPVSTYRIQFHKGFNIENLCAIEDYLQQLGIKTLYASPLQHAVPGSMHGYDVLDPLKPNPEVFEEALQIKKMLKAEGLNLVLDIVPNHMAYDPRNPYLRDVLQWGSSSPYASWFDIDWQRAPVMAPFLGSSVDKALQKRELKLSLQNGELVVSYFETHWPLSASSYTDIISRTGSDEAWKELGEKLKVLLQNDNMRDAWQQWLIDWERLLAHDRHKESLQRAIDAVNEEPSLLKQIIDSQYYRLCNWKETNERINYRRFFTVNSLICLNIQYPQVMKAHHEMISELVQLGLVSGLRIDHIDGLYDPGTYLKQLRKMV